MNADGYPDALVRYDRGSSHSAVHAFLSKGSAFVKTTVWSGTISWTSSKLCIAVDSTLSNGSAFTMRGYRRRK